MASFRRLEEAGATVEELILPPLDCGETLVTWLFEVGPGYNGEAVKYTDIMAWRDLTRTPLSPWEAMSIRHLSAQYMGEFVAARSAARGAPFSARATARSEVSQRLGDALRSFKNVKRRRR